MKTLLFSILLLITGCSPIYEPLPVLNAKMCTVVKVWGYKHEPEFIDIVYGARVYRVSGPFPYKSFEHGDDIMVLLPTTD